MSFPVFYRLEEKSVGKIEYTDYKDNMYKPYGHNLFAVIMEAMGTGMIVLCLLDFCRIYLDIPLHIPGKAYYLYPGSCVYE